MCRCRQYLSLCYVSIQLRIRGGLEPEKCHIARQNVALQRALCHFLRQAPCHDQLVFHFAERQLLGGGIAAVESHKGVRQTVRELSCNFLFIQVCRHCVVDVQ